MTTHPLTLFLSPQAVHPGSQQAQPEVKFFSQTLKSAESSSGRRRQNKERRRQYTDQ
jgi:hypothetical protein